MKMMMSLTSVLLLINISISILTTILAHEDHSSLSCGSAHDDPEDREEADAFMENWLSQRRRKLQEDDEDEETSSFVVPVCFHVIRPTNESEATNDTFLDAVHLQIQLDALNRGFSNSSCCNPDQYDWCEPGVCSLDSGFTFEMAQLNDDTGVLDLALGTNPSTTAGLPCMTRSYNDEWYESAYGSVPLLQMQSQLRQGDATVLNVYFTDVRDLFGAEKVLGGFARFPKEYGLAPKLDGVFVSIHTILPRDETEKIPETIHTIIHETGHWLGVFHVFDVQAGCTSTDFVTDTPVQKLPSALCNVEKDTCPNSPGLDSIHNFMDYTRDSCSFEFTAGQVEQMRAFMSVRQGYQELELIEATVVEMKNDDDIQSPRGTLLVPPVDLGAFQVQYYRIALNHTSTVTCMRNGLRLIMRKNAAPNVSLSLYDCGGMELLSINCTILYAQESVFAVVQAGGLGAKNFQLSCTITVLDSVVPLTLGIPQQVSLPMKGDSALFRLDDLAQDNVISCAVDPPGAGTMNIEFDYSSDTLERVLPQFQCTTNGKRCTQEILAGQNAMNVAISSVTQGETNLTLSCSATLKMADIMLEIGVPSAVVGRLEQFGMQMYQLEVERGSNHFQCVASRTSGDGTLSLQWGIRPQVLVSYDAFYDCRKASLELPCNTSYFGTGNIYFPVPRLFAVVEATTAIENLTVMCSLVAKSIETIENGVMVGPMSLESRKDKVFELRVSPNAVVDCVANASSSKDQPGEVDMYFKLDAPLDVALKSRSNCSAETSLSFETCSLTIPADSNSTSLFVTLLPFDGAVDGVTLVCHVNTTEPLETTTPPTRAPVESSNMFVRPVQLPPQPSSSTTGAQLTLLSWITVAALLS